MGSASLLCVTCLPGATLSRNPTMSARRYTTALWRPSCTLTTAAISMISFADSMRKRLPGGPTWSDSSRTPRRRRLFHLATRTTPRDRQGLRPHPQLRTADSRHSQLRATPPSAEIWIASPMHLRVSGNRPFGAAQSPGASRSPPGRGRKG
jgi:hypothetical protein